MRVAVIGAGFAGLAAADALARAGHELIVLEARDRVGGRVHSVPFAGTVVERGAEFVFDGHEVLIGLCERFGLELADKDIPYGDREPRGGMPTSREAIRAAAAGLAERAGVPGSLAEAIGGIDGDPAALAAVQARLEMTHAYPADALSTEALDDLGSAFGDYRSSTVAGGNQQIALRLAAGLDVRLGAPVGRILWDAGGARIGAGGDELHADRVVVAVPASVLGAIAFDPPLPEVLRGALERMRYGQAAKLAAPLLAPAPPDAVMSVPERFWSFTSRGPGGADPVLCGCFAGTPAAVAALAPDGDRDPAPYAAALGRLRPELALDLRPEAVLVSTWHDDPWARGAYAAGALSRAPGDDALLATPVGPLHWAGEHLGGHFGGYMEGALRTGLRAAAEIAPGA